jgi:hypothetical protein
VKFILVNIFLFRMVIYKENLPPLLFSFVLEYAITNVQGMKEPRGIELEWGAPISGVCC